MRLGNLLSISTSAPIGGALARRRQGARSPASRHWRVSGRPYLFVLPAVLFVAIFIYWPLLQVLFLSFHEWNMVSPQRALVGWQNYQTIVGDRDFLVVLWQSLKYVGLALLGNFLLPLGLAMLTLTVGDRRAGQYQALLFTPTVVATSVGALLWMWIYLPAGGLLNAALSVAGLPGTPWLTDPDTALSAIGVVGIWKFLGFNYLIALAGLKAVPRDYVEAAQVDGASGWRLVVGVVLPLLGPTLLFLALTAILQALPNVFVPIQILTKGGPAGASTNILYSVYETGFRFFQVGKASAEAVITMLLLAGAAFSYFRLLDRGLTYDR